MILKVDWKGAYKVVGINPQCYDASGIEWTFSGNSKPTYREDTRLMFGASKSPEIVQCISNSLVRMMEKKGYIVLVWLDDYIVLAEDCKSCWKASKTLIALLQKLV